MLTRSMSSTLIGLAIFAATAHVAAAQPVPAASPQFVRAPREVVVDLLRYATSEISLEDPAVDISNLLAIAEAQAILKDLEGLAKTTARIQAMIDKADAAEAKWLVRDAWPSLAGTYAWAGQMDKAKTYAAKVPTDQHVDDRLKMHAQMGDLARVDAVIAGLKPDDRETAYAHLGRNLWVGDRILAEKMLKKSVNLAGKLPVAAAHAYARIGDFLTASTLADATKFKYAWDSLAEEMESQHELDLARLAKLRYLVLHLQESISQQSVGLPTAFQYNLDLKNTDAAKSIAARLAREATQAITENKGDWQYQVTSAATAAEAAAQLGDEALEKSMLDAGAKIKVPAGDREDATEQLEGYAASGRARRLLANGNWKQAMEVGEGIESSLWMVTALSELVTDALRRGEVDVAMKVYAGIEEESVRIGDPIEKIARTLARMYVYGTPLSGKPVNLADWPRSLEEHGERGRAARYIVDELMRRGAVKS